MVEAAAAATRLDTARRRRRGSSAYVALSPTSGANANACNAVAARKASNHKPNNLKTVASRYLLTPYSTSSSSSASTAIDSRRSASPAPRRPAGATTGRSRPVVVPNNATAPVCAGSGATTTRTFSVAFQSPVYSLDTGKTRPVVSLSLAAATPVTLKKKRPSKNAGVLTAPRGRVSDDVLCPAAASATPSGSGGGAVARSVEHCSPDKKGAAATILAAVQPTALFDEMVPRRRSLDGAEYQRQTLSLSDAKSASSAGSQDNASAGAATTSGSSPSPRRSIMSSSARFAVGSRSDRFVGQTTPRTSGVTSPSPRTAPAKKKSLINTFLSSPFSRSATIIKQPASSPRTVTVVVTVAGKLHVKGSSAHCRGNAESDMRRKAPGDHKAEEEHLLRTLHSRHLQWRRANAHADAALSVQKLAAEEHLRGAWGAILGMRRSVALRKIQLQLLRNDRKLMTILRGQMIYLEESSLLEKEHSNSLSGTVGALNANVLRLPVSDGADADIQGVKNAVASAVDVMQIIENSTNNLKSKLAQANASLSQLCGVAIQERALMAQCRELLSMVTSMHVKYCSLKGQRVQLPRWPRGGHGVHSSEP